jgi:hypothetical protein
VFDLLLRDMAFDTVIDPSKVAWDEPVFVLRSNMMGHLQALLRQISAYCPNPDLHIMSHVRDEAAIRSAASGHVTFYPYPTPGRYKLEEVPAVTLGRLRAIKFQKAIVLDGTTVSQGLDEVLRLAESIGAVEMLCYTGGGTLARPASWRRCRHASTALQSLADWCQFRADPASRSLFAD